MVQRIFADYPAESGAASRPNPNSFPQIYVVAQSAVPVTLTGNTVETVMATIPIPRNAIGPSGSLRITTFWSHTNSANSKVTRLRFGGQLISSTTTSATATLHNQYMLRNRGAANSQAGFNGASISYGASAAVALATNVDTTADQLVTITGTLALAGETITLEGYTVEVLPSA